MNLKTLNFEQGTSNFEQGTRNVEQGTKNDEQRTRNVEQGTENRQQIPLRALAPLRQKRLQIDDLRFVI